MAFINEEELKIAWEKRSKLNYETGEGDKQLKFIIWHFMASKNLHKDKEGVAQLSDKEIKAIEERIPSVVMLKGGFNARFYEIRNQLADTEPDGKSLLMRLIYFKLGWQITKENFPFGVGSGDVQDAFNAKYANNSFGLSKEYWNRAHNQYLTVLISSGIIGFILFLLIWFAIIRTSFKSKHYLFALLTVIVLSSFLSEDTLESQTGVTIAAFLIGAFINFSKIQINRDSIR
ncbi:MAG: O-antigen ligase family protein [Fluviicola sp.]